jgi:hypothetical protein
VRDYTLSFLLVSQYLKTRYYIHIYTRQRKKQRVSRFCSCILTVCHFSRSGSSPDEKSRIWKEAGPTQEIYTRTHVWFYMYSINNDRGDERLDHLCHFSSGLLLIGDSYK